MTVLMFMAENDPSSVRMAEALASARHEPGIRIAPGWPPDPALPTVLKALRESHAVSRPDLAVAASDHPFPEADIVIALSPLSDSLRARLLGHPEIVEWKLANGSPSDEAAISLGLSHHQNRRISTFFIDRHAGDGNSSGTYRLDYDAISDYLD